MEVYTIICTYNVYNNILYAIIRRLRDFKNNCPFFYPFTYNKKIIINVICKIKLETTNILQPNKNVVGFYRTINVLKLL